MKIEVHPDLRALDETRWNGLLDRSRLPSVFLTWQWQTEWSQAFTADRPKQILAATDTGGELAGLLPLYEDGP
ncbi:MAG TPA: GNAT family N-acetyltransferase, partial [Candidatus Dormibacteraeota bacterium]|nr:GNAT family N-acetyltransferase [Candidatus Dormibacteraeota bacterium]